MPTYEGFLPSATPTGQPIALAVYRGNDGVRRSLDSNYPTVDQEATVYPTADEALTEAVRRWGNDPDDDEIDRADAEWDDNLEPEWERGWGRGRTVMLTIKSMFLFIALALVSGCGGDPFGSFPVNVQVDAGNDAQGGSAGSSQAGSGGTAGSQAGSSGEAGDAGVGGTEAGTGGTGGDPPDASDESDGSTGVGGTGGVGGSAGGSAGTGGAPGCPTGMVSVPPGYCIDSTEVTRGAYAAWLATSPSTSGQPAACSWNADYAPESACASNTQVCQGSGCSNHPQVCVDWCDAYAYCKAAGKRLCGKIGGGDNAYGDYGNASKSQWFNACTKGASTSYPYGNSFEPDACNGMDKSIDSTVPVGSLTGCEGGFPGVFDMSGNAWEWEDSCNGTNGNEDVCRLRGGSFGNWSNYLNCDLPYQGNARSYYSQYIGLRCCS